MFSEGYLKYKNIVGIFIFCIVCSIFFTACSDTKKEYLTTTQQLLTTTRQVSTTTFNKKREVITTQVLTTEATITRLQIETTKAKQTTAKEQHTTKQGLNIVTIYPTIKEYNKERLNLILEKVDKALENKDKDEFSALSRKFIKEGVENIFYNYEEWRVGYNDLPTIEEYIAETIIPGINRAGSLRMIKYDSEEAQEMLNDGSALAGTIGDECCMYLIYNDPKECTKEDHLEDLEMLFHELKHCKDRKVLFDEEHFEDDSDIKDFFTEGGATFHEKFSKPFTAEHLYTEDITNTSGTKCIEYGKDDGVGYILDAYIYENLVYLAGYKTVEAVGQGADLSTIKDAMAKNYGEDTANFLWDDLCNLYYYSESAREDDDTFKHAIATQNRILGCIEQDIKNLNEKDPEQIRKFMDVYRNYKFKIMPQVTKDIINVITPEVFDTDRLDNLLIEKIEKSGAIGKFSSNSKLNKMALKAILLSNNQSYDRMDGIRADLYLPNSIAATQYSYYEKDGKGHIVMNYTDKYGKDENVGIEFNEEKIIRIFESKEIEQIH